MKVTVLPITTLQMVLCPARPVRKPWTTSQSLGKLAASLVGQKRTTHPVIKVIQNTCTLRGSTIMLHTFTCGSLTHSRSFVQQVKFAIVIPNIWGTSISWLPRVCSHELLKLSSPWQESIDVSFIFVNIRFHLLVIKTLRSFKRMHSWWKWS